MIGAARTLHALRRVFGRRSVVVVLGMHRSGTSMLTRFLAARGLDAGTRLLTDSVSDNVHGYWEHAEIVDVQERLLDALDRTWYGPNGALPLPEGWLEDSRTVDARERLASILEREVAESRGLWGFKDPRTTRLLPLWRPIFDRLRLRPTYLLAVRSPAAVAASVIQRTPMAVDHAESLWAIHNVDAVDATGGRFAAVIDYDRWFTDGERMAARLTRVLGLPDRELGSETLGRYVDPALRHNELRPEMARPAVAALYRALASDAPGRKWRAALRTAVEQARLDLGRDALARRDTRGTSA